MPLNSKLFYYGQNDMTTMINEKQKSNFKNGCN